MTAANHGRGQCVEVLDNGRQCPQAAYSDDHCYWHGKLDERLTRRLAPESKQPAPRKKATK